MSARYQTIAHDDEARGAPIAHDNANRVCKHEAAHGVVGCVINASQYCTEAVVGMCDYVAPRCVSVHICESMCARESAMSLCVCMPLGLRKIPGSTSTTHNFMEATRVGGGCMAKPGGGLRGPAEPRCDARRGTLPPPPRHRATQKHKQNTKQKHTTTKNRTKTLRKPAAKQRRDDPPRRLTPSRSPAPPRSPPRRIPFSARDCHVRRSSYQLLMVNPMVAIATRP